MKSLKQILILGILAFASCEGEDHCDKDAQKMHAEGRDPIDGPLTKYRAKEPDFAKKMGVSQFDMGATYGPYEQDQEYFKQGAGLQDIRDKYQKELDQIREETPDFKPRPAPDFGSIPAPEFKPIPAPKFEPYKRSEAERSRSIESWRQLCKARLHEKNKKLEYTPYPAPYDQNKYKQLPFTPWTPHPAPRPVPLKPPAGWA